MFIIIFIDNWFLYTPFHFKIYTFIKHFQMYSNTQTCIETKVLLSCYNVT